MLDLKAIEERAAAASPGNWEVRVEAYGPGKRVEVVGAQLSARINCHLSGPYGAASLRLRTADAEFIANAKQDIPALVAELRRLKEEQTELLREIHEVATAARLAARKVGLPPDKADWFDREVQGEELRAFKEHEARAALGGGK